MIYYDGYGNKYDTEKDTVDYDLSPLDGKVCLAIGDSYTNMMCSDGGALLAFNTSLGMTTQNCGITGCTYGDKGTKGSAYEPIVCRVCHTDTNSPDDVVCTHTVPWDLENVGYIFIMGGINDSLIYPYTTGTDGCDSDQTHLYGAVNLTLSTLIEKYPDTPIIIGLEPLAYSLDPTSIAEQVDRTTDYTTVHKTDVTGLSAEVFGAHYERQKQMIIREVSEIFAQAYPDLIRIADFCFDWYSPLNPTQKTTYWSGDKLHLSTQGFNAIVTGGTHDSIQSCLRELFPA